MFPQNPGASQRQNIHLITKMMLQKGTHVHSIIIKRQFGLNIKVNGGIQTIQEKLNH
jgi:hypothetical protein